MRRVVCVLLSLSLFLLVPNFASANSTGLTFDEFVYGYENASKSFVGSPVRVGFEYAGTADQQKIYSAELDKDIHFDVFCDERTDEVLSAAVQFNIHLFPDNQATNLYLKGIIWDSSSRMLLSVLPDISVIDLYSCLSQIDLLNLVGVNNSVVIGDIEYTYCVDNGIVTYGLNNSTAVLPESNGSYRIAPGLYKVGKDIPTGSYDVRFNDLDKKAVIRYSWSLDSSGKPDMSAYNAFSVEYESTWNQAIYAVISLYSEGYLEIEHSPLIFWPE